MKSALRGAEPTQSNQSSQPKGSPMRQVFAALAFGCFSASAQIMSINPVTLSKQYPVGGCSFPA
jgi:hypothetical protein